MRAYGPAFTPAAYGANPMRTGVQSFLYDIRTSILPIVFIFNPELLLVGVTSIWHGLMIFVVSLIVILCFASITQGWLLTRLSIVERVVLAIVVIALFRPDAVMNRVFPQYSPIATAQIVSADGAKLPTDRAVRLHVTRETEYGDRFKLFVIPPTGAAGGEPLSIGERAGLTLDLGSDGRFNVSNTKFNGPGETVGITFGDYVTAVDVEQIGRPAKEWIYLIGLALLGLVFFWQAGKKRRGVHATTEPAIGKNS